MHLGPRKRPRLRFRRIRPLVSRGRVVLILLVAFACMAAGLVAAARFTAGQLTVGGADQAVILALASAFALGMGWVADRPVRAVWRRIRRRRAERAMRPAGPPIEEIAADLRRMLREHDRAVRSGRVATTARRVRALEASISTAALQAARALQLAHPKPAPYQGLETWQLRGLLRALRAEGLVLPADVGLTRPESPF